MVFGEKIDFQTFFYQMSKLKRFGKLNCEK
jgi:hypothetical protein